MVSSAALNVTKCLGCCQLEKALSAPCPHGVCWGAATGAWELSTKGDQLLLQAAPQITALALLVLSVSGSDLPALVSSGTDLALVYIGIDFCFRCDGH